MIHFNIIILNQMISINDATHITGFFGSTSGICQKKIGAQVFLPLDPGREGRFVIVNQVSTDVVGASSSLTLLLGSLTF